MCWVLKRAAVPCPRPLGSYLAPSLCALELIRKFPYDPAGGLAQSSQGFANLSVLKINSKHVANAKLLWSSMISVCVKECRYQHVLHDLRGEFFHLGSRRALLRNFLFLNGQGGWRSSKESAVG